MLGENLLSMRRRFRTSVSAAALFLAAYGPLGMVLDFADASVAIVSSGGSLDYQSQGQVSNGALVGPGAKLTNTAPSLKLTEQADGFIKFQAHNLALWSEDFTNSAWFKDTVTVTADADGTADLITEVGGASASVVHNNADIAILTNATYKLNWRVKRSNVQWVRVVATNNSSDTQAVIVWADIQNGVVGGHVFNGSGFSLLSKTVVPAPDAPGYFDVAVEFSYSLGSTLRCWINSATADLSSTRVAGGAYFLARCHVRRTPSVSDYIATTTAAAYDLPYVYSSGVRLGLHPPEPAATNLCTYGATVGDANWSNVNTTATPAAAVGPTGGNDLALITATVAGGFIRRIHSQTLSVFTAYTTSCFLKAGTSGRSRLALHDGVVEPGSVDILWTAGVPSTFALSGTATAATYTHVGSGIYRATVTITTSASATSGRFHFYPDVSGTGTCYMGIAQQELGTVATSPIITYGSPVLRALDNIHIATTNFPYSATELLLYAELITPDGGFTATHVACAMKNSTGFGVTGPNAYISVGPGITTSAWYSSGVNKNFASAPSAGSVLKLAGTFKTAGTLAAATNQGQAAATSSASAWDGSSARLQIGALDANGAQTARGVIKRLMVLPVYDTAKIQAVTA